MRKHNNYRTNKNSLPNGMELILMLIQKLYLIIRPHFLICLFSSFMISLAHIVFSRVSLLICKQKTWQRCSGEHNTKLFGSGEYNTLSLSIHCNNMIIVPRHTYMLLGQKPDQHSLAKRPEYVLVIRDLPHHDHHISDTILNFRS